MKTFTHPLLFWIAAAFLVLATHGFVDPYSNAAGALLKVGAIVVAAFLYVRLTARNATVDHAVFVGLAWLMLDIISEMTLRVDLLGSTSAPATRNLILVTWIAAPALFARVSSVPPWEHLKSS